MLLFFGVLFCSFCESFAERVRLELSSPDHLIIGPPEDASTWFRLERTGDLEEWLTMRDTISWPTKVSIDPRTITTQFYRIVSVATPEPPFTIGVIGDSTAVGIQGFPLVDGWD